MQAYCLKCRSHRDLPEVTFKNGRPATRLGMQLAVFRIGKAE